MSYPSSFLNISDAAAEMFHKIQLQGNCDESNLAMFSPNERAFLTAELFVRTSRYSEISANIPPEADEWWRSLALCTGHLFTSPALALEKLDFLEQHLVNEFWRLRLKAWRMHLLLLIGFEREGKLLREEVAAQAIEKNPWLIEIETLLAISYFSTAESEIAILRHYHCFKLLKKHSEQFFRTFGAAVAMRASLKICDAEAFEFFSNHLDQALAHTPDSRYRLRQLGYRAVILTQLGERDLAQRYWTEGDQLLEYVDPGCASVERIQYHSFRLLAGSLLGDHRRVEIAYDNALRELNEAKFYEVHFAELEICHTLSPISNPVVRSKNLARSFHVATEASALFEQRAAEATLESVKMCYLEARDFCRSLLEGNPRRAKHTDEDKWLTLTLSIIDNYQSFAEFAEKIDYFRLLPKFIHELQKSSLTDKGLMAALERVIKFTPRLTSKGFEISFEREGLSRVSQIDILLNFANTLRGLYKEKEESNRARILAESVQIVAHEFRRPFNLLRFTLQGLASCDDPGKVMELIQKGLPTILEASQDVNRLLEDVQDTVRPIKLERQVIKPSTVILAALESLNSPQLKSNFKITPSCDIAIEGDKAKLARAVANIVENATHAAPDQEIWVKTNKDVVEGREAVTFTIGNGSYISREDRKRIFEKYFSKGKTLGTGLGLYIVKKIVDEHGGLVRCRSSRKYGTEFDLVIPVNTKHQIDAAQISRLH